MNTSSTLATRLLRLPDKHGALLAEFDWYADFDLLHVRWHGHLTAESKIAGSRAGMSLFEARRIPRRLLSDHSRVSGDWSEALPWLHYEWLPAAVAGALQAVAHIFSPDPASNLPGRPGYAELAAVFTRHMQAQAFRNFAPAWQWLTHR